jgi:hypothetical protein
MFIPYIEGEVCRELSIVGWYFGMPGRYSVFFVLNILLALPILESLGNTLVRWVLSFRGFFHEDTASLIIV